MAGTCWNRNLIQLAALTGFAIISSRLILSVSSQNGPSQYNADYLKWLNLTDEERLTAQVQALCDVTGFNLRGPGSNLEECVKTYGKNGSFITTIFTRENITDLDAKLQQCLSLIIDANGNIKGCKADKQDLDLINSVYSYIQLGLQYVSGTQTESDESVEPFVDCLLDVMRGTMTHLPTDNSSRHGLCNYNAPIPDYCIPKTLCMNTPSNCTNVCVEETEFGTDAISACFDQAALWWHYQADLNTGDGNAQKPIWKFY